jgi:hypothetical protein
MRGAMADDLSAAISSRPIAVFHIAQEETAELVRELAEDGDMFCLDKFQKDCVA